MATVMHWSLHGHGLSCISTEFKRLHPTGARFYNSHVCGKTQDGIKGRMQRSHVLHAHGLVGTQASFCAIVHSMSVSIRVDCVHWHTGLFFMNMTHIPLSRRAGGNAAALTGRLRPSTGAVCPRAEEVFTSVEVEAE